MGRTYIEMEITGVFWKPVAKLLEAEDIDFLVVNPQHMKALPGRKTDVKDAKWIAKFLRQVPGQAFSQGKMKVPEKENPRKLAKATNISERHLLMSPTPFADPTTTWEPSTDASPPEKADTEQP
jgi:transposase